MKPAIYLAGPMLGCSPEEATGWRVRVNKVIWKNFQSSVHVYDPTYFGVDLLKGVNDLDQQAKVMVDADLSVINRCWMVLVNSWKDSSGTMGEIVHAHHQGIPVVTMYNRPENGWIRYYSTKIVRTEAEGIGETIKYLRIMMGGTRA